MGVTFTNHFSTHQISSRNYYVGLCYFSYTSYATTRQLCAPTSSLLGLGHHINPSALQHRPCRSVDFKHIRPTPPWSPLHRVNDIGLIVLLSMRRISPFYNSTAHFTPLRVCLFRALLGSFSSSLPESDSMNYKLSIQNYISRVPTCPLSKPVVRSGATLHSRAAAHSE